MKFERIKSDKSKRYKNYFFITEEIREAVIKLSEKVKSNRKLTKLIGYKGGSQAYNIMYGRQSSIHGSIITNIEKLCDECGI